jgi:hypothetical protein
VNAGFLGELAPRCGFKVLALVKAALRHLPPRAVTLGRIATI